MKQSARFFSLMLILASFAADAATEPPPPWAYGFKEPPPPGTAQVPPAGAGPTPTDPTTYGLPGTERKFTRAADHEYFRPSGLLSR